MWKVKRMNTARIVDLTIANGVGGIAACHNTPAAPAELVLPLHTLEPQTWPAAPADSHFINLRGESISALRHGAASRQSMQT
jgi:pilus assembly protein CpaB